MPMVLAILHNVIIGQPVRLDACISVGFRLYYNATLCYLASGSFYTGISEVVVVVGTKRLIVAMLWIGLALWLCNEVEQAMCQ